MLFVKQVEKPCAGKIEAHGNVKIPGSTDRKFKNLMAKSEVFRPAEEIMLAGKHFCLYTLAEKGYLDSE